MQGLLDFAKRNKGKEIYVFGLCERGKTIYRCLTENEVEVKGFLISEVYDKTTDSTFYLKEIDADNSAVIFSIKYKNFNDVIPQFVTAGISNIYFLNGNDDQLLEYYNVYFTDGKPLEEMFPDSWIIYNTAKKILEHISSEVSIHSAIDFGCGCGAWLKAVKDVFPGAKVLGIDGSEINREEFLAEDEFKKSDLSQYIFSENEKYDMAITIEVIEHIEEEKANQFVDNLCKAADIILFSAAIKWQGGDYHVNEQYTSYWVKKFEERGYEYVDCIRRKFWNDKDMQLHCRQNCVLFVKKEKIGKIKEHLDPSVEYVDWVHPELYDMKMGAVHERTIY